MNPKPFKEYRIKLADGRKIPHAVKTRNVWNDKVTGKFIAYDSQVVDYEGHFTCPNCMDTVLLWYSQFDEDNHYQINCDYCDTRLEEV